MTVLKKLKWWLFGIPYVPAHIAAKFWFENECSIAFDRGYKWKLGAYVSESYAHYRYEGLTPTEALNESLRDWDLI